LVGDSAGGNLVACNKEKINFDIYLNIKFLFTALTLLCIKMGLRVPDGIVLVYPALNLNIHNYSPSLLLALDDQILPHTFLKICLNSYVENDF
jgi:hormone-sensitive lipase